jgi:hypothetical protein
MPSNTKTYLEKARAEAIAGGYCITCRRKGNQAKPGCKMCISCIDAQAARNEKKLAEGICRECCKDPRLEGINRCARCKIRAKLVTSRQRLARAKVGLCRFFGCQNLRDPGYSSCVNCRAKARMMRVK